MPGHSTERFDQVQAAVRREPALPPVHATPSPRPARPMACSPPRCAPRSTTRSPLSGTWTAPPRAVVERWREAGEAHRGGSAEDLPAEDTRALLAAYGIDLLVSHRFTDVDAPSPRPPGSGTRGTEGTDPCCAIARTRRGAAGHPGRGAAAPRRRDAPGPVLLERAARGAGHGPAGVPMVVRSVEDPSLGPVVSLSVAGDATDLLDDIAYAIPPFSETAAARLVDTPASAVKLRGTRGLPRADRAALADLVVRIGLLAEDLPELASLELYPVLVAQHGTTVVGARARLAPAPNRTDGTRRALSGPAAL